jgi:hypothetical protein
MRRVSVSWHDIAFLRGLPWERCKSLPHVIKLGATLPMPGPDAGRAARISPPLTGQARYDAANGGTGGISN